MSHELIELNDDLRRLRDEGYNVDIVGANLIVRDIPYVNGHGEVLHDGILVSALNLNGKIVNEPNDHTMKFSGQTPCTRDGRVYDAIRPEPGVTNISDKLATQFTFSSKPFENGQYRQYRSYYEKVRTYAAMLCAQAKAIDPDADPRTFRVVEPQEDDSPFYYLDTASARAEINAVTAKLRTEKVAIVGLGGTGSYILDLLAKTPIKEIHLFDGDKFSSHNAFRAPGAASIDDLHKQLLKVDYLKEIYSQMHRGVIPHGEEVGESNIEQLRAMNFVFLGMDSGPTKRLIVDKLAEFDIPFIDVGLGLYEKNEQIGGMVRVTMSDSAGREAARARMCFGDVDGNNEYERNIQIADLNALNAALAVIRWKKTRGFYFNMKHEAYCSYSVGSNLLVNDDIREPAN